MEPRNSKAVQNEIERERERTAVREAYESVGAALGSLPARSDERNFERYVSLQEAYFDLKATLRALDPEFQRFDSLGHTGMNVPTAHGQFEAVTVEDEHGEWEVPTRQDSFRVFSSFEVAHPMNPHTTSAVTVDHVISQDGDVSVEINGKPLDDIPPSDDSRAPW